MAGPRLDKWLWAARFFRTRSQAKAAIDAGHVRLAGGRVKAAKEVRRGDALSIRRGRDEWAIEVTGLAGRRGDATAAARLYQETAASLKRRADAAVARRAPAAGAAASAGRPTKKARRQLKAWRGGGRD